MPRTTLALSSFVSGEFSAKLDGRTDFEKYSSGCKTLENMLVHPQGAATRRVGTQFISEVKDSSAKTRLIPFEFSITQTYMLEFGNQYIRFFKDKGQITESNKTITGITAANPAVVTSSSHGYSNGDFVIITGVVGMTQVNGKTFKVADKTTNTFELQDVDGTDINSSGYTAYSSGGVANKIYQITTSYTTAQLPDLKFAQSADVLYITHSSHEVSKLSRTGHTSWTLSEVDFGETGPYLSENTTATTLTPASSGTGTGVNITASSTTGINGGDGWQTTDVGRIIKFNSGEAKITARTNTTVVVCTITKAFANTDATATFSLGAFSDTTGHPSCVSFFEQRLVFAGTTDEPQTLYFSKSGDYENMTVGTNADDAMVYTIASNQVNAIRYLKAVRTLIVGTSGGEWTVSADGTDAAVTPSNVTIKRQSSYGSATVDAVPAGNATLFLQKAKRKIRELAYDFDVDGYSAPDLTILNETVTDSGIDEMSYQQSPDSNLWCVRNDGVLACLTYQRSENVVSWSRHKIGGIGQECTITVSDYANIATGTKLVFTKSNGEEVTFTSTTGTAGTDEFKTETNNDTTADNIYTAINAHADFTVANPGAAIVTIRESSHEATGFLTCKSFDTARLTVQNESHAVVESVASISGELNEDELWVIVKRIINGSTRRYVECFSDFDFDETTASDFHFVDSGLSYDGTATTSITGLDHLEGQTVQILADGSTHADKIVSSGAITLDRSSKKVKVGLGYNSVLQTMRVEGGSAEGTGQGKVKRISKVVLRLFNTVGVKCGPSLTNLETVPFRTTSSDMDNPVSTLLAGDKTVEFTDDYNSDGFIFVKQDQPLPLSLLALYPTFVISDG
jgi:hypothetical protein